MCGTTRGKLLRYAIERSEGGQPAVAAGSKQELQPQQGSGHSEAVDCIVSGRVVVCYVCTGEQAGMMLASGEGTRQLASRSPIVWDGEEKVDVQRRLGLPQFAS